MTPSDPVTGIFTMRTDPATQGMHAITAHDATRLG